MALPTLVTGGYPLNDSRNYTVSSYQGTLVGGGAQGNGTNAVTYSIGGVTSTTQITNAKFTEMINAMNAERARRIQATTPITLSTLINHNDYNAIRNGINVYGPASSDAYNTDGAINITTSPQAGPPTLPPAANTGDLIAGGTSGTFTAQGINALISSIVNAGQACTCNCNYCTCNCNYCTCNCNYSCTCNCNYSDERLKENIEYARTENGINLYSWNYLWDKTTSYVGVIAQEIIGTDYVSAISTDASGYYMVDYSKLPVSMTRG